MPRPRRRMRARVLRAHDTASEIAAVPRKRGIESGPSRGEATTGDVAVRICLEELRANAESGAARCVALERRVALLGTEGVVSGLVAAAVNGQDGDRESSLEVFEALIELARVDGGIAAVSAHVSWKRRPPRSRSLRYSAASSRP